MTGSVTMIKSPVVGICSSAERSVDWLVMESVLIWDLAVEEEDP